jgi:hypothetical protein
MSPNADGKWNRMHEFFHFRYSPAHTARDTARANCLREIQEDVIIISPKVYESGIITRLDLRLVDLYGDCAMVSDDVNPACGEHELIS